MKKLITFITPSRRLDNIREFFDNIESTAFDPGCVEVLIKFDDDQQGVKEFIEHEVSKRSFSIKYIITPRLEGIYSVWVAMEQLFFESDASSYFVQIISDEPRFLTKHWDKVLSRYIGFYKDDVFRLRLSEMKCASYSSHYECTFRPDSFPIYTRRWLELTEGSGDCWGSDAYQQCVAFQLSMGPGSYANIYREQGLCRDVPIFDIELGGLEFCVGVSSEDQRERHWRNLKEWARLATFPKQEHFSYLARRINAYVWAMQHGIEEFRLVKCVNTKTVAVVTPDGQKLMAFTYAVSRVVVYSQNLFRYYIIKPRHSIVWFLSGVKRLFSRELAESAVSSMIRGLRVLEIGMKVVKRRVAAIRNLVFGLPKSRQYVVSQTWPLKRRVRLAIQKAITIGLVPYYFIGNQVDKLLALEPPGISSLYKRNSKMPGKIPQPTNAHIDWLRAELGAQEQIRQELRSKVFSVKKETALVKVCEKN